MKGKSSCYRVGGKVRNIGGGMKAPAYGTNPNVMAEAKGKSTGIVKMDGPDGGPSKARLDRPGRKWGGRAMAKMKSKDKDGDDDDDRGYASGGAIKPGFIKHPGALRSALGAKEGEDIPAKKLEKATHSDNPTLRRRAVLAETMKKWKH